MGNKFVTPVGKLAWSNIVQQGLNLKQELEWNCGFILSEDDSQGIMANLEKTLEDYRKVNASFPKTNTGLNYPFGPSMKKNDAGVKVAEPGMIAFKFKRPGAIFRRATGSKEENTAPLVFDSMGRPVRNVASIGPGSLGKVVYDTYGYDKAGQRGVGLQLLGFQIVKLEIDTIELEAVEGGWTPEQDQPASAMDQLLLSDGSAGDEIGF